MKAFSDRDDIPCIKTLLSKVYSTVPQDSSVFKEKFEMLLTPSFLLAILFIMISPILAFDDSRVKESAASWDDIRGFDNIPRRSSKVAFTFFCRFASLRCCGAKDSF